jgi:hypothetical protein
MEKRTRALLSAIVVSAAALGAPAASHAAVGFSLTAPEGLLSWPERTSVSYGVILTNTGGDEAAVSVTPTPAAASVRGGGTVLVPTAGYVAGPALMTAVTVAAPSLAHHPGCDRPHGAIGLGLETYALTLPPASESTLVVPFSLIAAPWPGERIAPRFTAVGPDGTVTLAATQPALAGRSGVRIVLRSSPASGTSGPKRVGRGRRVSLRGRAGRAAARQLLSLWVTRFRKLDGGGLSPVRTSRISRVRADRNGRFRGAWVARRRGTYGLYATYRSQSRAAADDALPCSLLFRVS